MISVPGAMPESLNPNKALKAGRVLDKLGGHG